MPKPILEKLLRNMTIPIRLCMDLISEVEVNGNIQMRPEFEWVLEHQL